MNRTRVAQLLRELADEFEAEDVPEDRPSRPRRKRSKPAHTEPVNELEQAHARKRLRSLGVALEDE